VIERLDDPEGARAWCEEQRASGHSLGLVPTMGALHEGHLELVRRAVAENDAACVSVFVNPLQFDDPGDLERYPRDLDGDARLLDGAGAAMVFTGTLAGFFPGSGGDPSAVPAVDPGPPAGGLEGEFRKGHFAGVATICDRLFELTGADRAYFGEKDFQQTLVVKHVAERRGAPRIVVCPTSREPSGLARSSRNELLDGSGLERAVALSRGLRAARALWAAGEREPGALCAALAAELTGVEPEYAEVRDPEAWTADRPAGPLTRAQALVAARVGPVRLIDNLRLDAPA
jgi:pantoate--beta-alanine ligase